MLFLPASNAAAEMSAAAKFTTSPSGFAAQVLANLMSVEQEEHGYTYSTRETVLVPTASLALTRR